MQYICSDHPQFVLRSFQDVGEVSLELVALLRVPSGLHIGEVDIQKGRAVLTASEVLYEGIEM